MRCKFSSVIPGYIFCRPALDAGSSKEAGLNKLGKCVIVILVY